MDYEHTDYKVIPAPDCPRCKSAMVVRIGNGSMTSTCVNCQYFIREVEGQAFYGRTVLEAFTK